MVTEEGLAAKANEDNFPAGVPCLPGSAGGPPPAQKTPQTDVLPGYSRVSPALVKRRQAYALVTQGLDAEAEVTSGLPCALSASLRFGELSVG